jgi:hypothetical protein
MTLAADACSAALTPHALMDFVGAMFHEECCYQVSSVSVYQGQILVPAE